MLLLGIVNGITAQIVNTEIFKQRALTEDADPRAKPGEASSDSLESSQPAPASSLPPLIGGFVKEGEQIPPGVMFFNVLKVTNQLDEPQRFSIQFTKPSFANLLIQESHKGIIEVGPGQKSFVPIRVSFPSQSEGGVPYTITAIVQHEASGRTDTTQCQVIFQKISKWRASTPMAKKYVPRGFEGFIEVPIRIKNLGNSMEQISIDFQLGKQLKYEGEARSVFSWNFPIRPMVDTTIIAPIALKPNRSAFSDPEAYTVHVNISTEQDSTVQPLSILLEEVAQGFENLVDLSDAPLIIEYRQQGLNPSSSDLNIGGKILMVDDRELSYTVALNDLQSPSNPGQKPFSLQNINGNIKYQTPRSFIKAGNIGGGAGVSVNGLGISLGHHFGSLDPGQGVETRLITGYNPRSSEWGVSGLARWTTPSKLGLSIGAGVKRNLLEQSTLMGIQSSGQYSFLTNHSVGLTVGTTYKSGPDTLAGPRGWGAAYSLQYSGKLYDRVSLGFENEYISSNYANAQGGIFNFKVEGGYEVNANSKVGSSYSSHTNQILGDTQDGSPRTLGKSQLTAFRTAYNVRLKHFNLGTSIERSTQKTTMANEQQNKSMRSLGLKVGLSKTWQKGGDNSMKISPSLIVGYQSSAAEFGVGGDVYAASQLTTQIGLKGQFKGLSMDARFLNMPGRQTGASLVTGSQMTTAFTGGYKKKFMDDRLEYQANADLRYNISERLLESILSSSLDFELQNGWSIGAVAKLDLSKLSQKKDAESLSIRLKAAKAFDFDQPRLKFYNLIIQFYKDENGNLIWDADEEGIGNILVKLERAKDPSNLVINGVKIQFTAPETLSEVEGLVNYKKIPQGHYLIELKELAVIKDFANLAGKDFEVFMREHATFSVAYSKSVTIEGRTAIQRDKFSRLFGISPAKIRITIKDANGKMYHTLTSSNGAYSITLPFSQSYSVSMKNVLGDKFDLLVPQVEVAPEEGNSKYKVDFQYKEKGRGINFGS